MPGLRFEIEAAGVIRRYTDIIKRLLNMQPVLDFRVIQLAQEMFKDQFETEGASAWAPLSEGYRARKERDRPGKTILRYDDLMFAALTQNLGADSVFTQRAGGTSVLDINVDPDIGYWIFHQLGTDTMPARELLPDPLPPEFLSELKRVVRAYIVFGRF